MYWPLFAIFAIIAIFFYPVWLKGLIPLPTDFIVGTYYPWYDYKWGYEVGVPVKNPLTSDVVSVIYPLRSLAVDIFKEGKIPLWNPTMFAGYPLLANFQAAILSPTMLLYVFLPKMWAWSGQVVAQPLVGMIGMYLLLRNFSLKKTASIVGALIYAFSGFSMIWLEWNAHGLVAAWIPFVLLSFDKYMRNGKLYWGVLLSVFLCFQILSGYPQLVLYTLALLLAYGFIVLRAFTGKRMFFALSFIIIGLLLSSIQLVPGLELYLNSQRVTEALDSDLIYLPWRNMITFLAPDFYGNPSTGNYWGLGNYTLNVGYAGVVTLILALIGARSYWKRSVIKYLLLVLVISLLLSLRNPISQLIYDLSIPGISASSFTRVLVIVNFSLACLGAFGVQRLISKKKGNEYYYSIIVLTIILGVLLGVILSRFIVPDTVEMHKYLGITLRNLMLPFLLVLATTVLIIIRHKYIKNDSIRKIVVLLIFLILMFELFRYGWKFNPFSRADLAYPQTKVTEYLDNQEGIFRLSTTNTIPMNMWVPFGYESVSGYDAVYPLLWSEFASAINNDKVGGTMTRYADFTNYSSKWFDLMNNKYLMVIKPNENVSTDNPMLYYEFDVDPKFKNVFEDRSVVVMENVDVEPRAYFSTNWVTLANNKVLHNLISNEHNKNTIYIEEEYEPEINSDDDFENYVNYVFYSPNKSVLDVSSSEPGLLFVSDAYYPGWKVYVDGVQRDVYRANYVFRAVPLGTGKYKVEFIYDPRSFKIGYVVTLLSLFTLTGIVIYENTKKRN